MARPMPEPPSWTYRITFALVGVELGAFAVALFNGREEIALLDQISTPIGVITGAVAIYLVLYDFAGRPTNATPAHRPGWRGTIVVTLLCSLVGGVAFAQIASANAEKRDIFAVHYGIWKEPCHPHDGPVLLNDK